MNHMTHKQSFLIRAAALAGSIFFIPALPAQTPAWFPLEVGNAWLYRPVPTSSTRSANLEYRNIWAHGTESIDGRDYFDVLYFGREIALRAEPSDGSIYVFDKASGTEKLWLAPGRPVGSTFSTEVNPCPTTATIAARDASVTTSAGKFDNAVEVEFQGNCVDVGVTKQLYASNVGLVSDEETTFCRPGDLRALLLPRWYEHVLDRRVVHSRPQQLTLHRRHDARGAAYAPQYHSRPDPSSFSERAVV